MSRLVVCDTGPLIHLKEANAFDLLNLAGGILIPPAVADEFTTIMPDFKLPAWIQIHRLNETVDARVQSWCERNYVDPGEAEAIGLALQEKSDWLLTDDAQARQFAEHLGLEVHGSIGLLLWFVAVGHISEQAQAHQLLRGLERSSLWISARVLSEARMMIDRLFSEQ